MIGFLAPFFIRAGLGGKGARLASIGLMVAIALGVVGLIVLRIRADAVRDERREQAVQIERDKAAQREREATAEEARRADEARARSDADTRRKEIDNATRNIPDQAPTARQRARVCAELRRQAAPERELAAACGPAGPR